MESAVDAQTADKPASGGNSLSAARVLVFVDYFLPGEKSGGPWVAVEGLVRALSPRLEFFIVSRDRDLGANAPYSGIRSGRWITGVVGPQLYLRPCQLGLRRFRRLVAELAPNAIYVNGLFSWFSIAPLLARRLGVATDVDVVVAPRGQLDPGALRLKRWKKRPFLRFARSTGLLRGVRWHATSALEARHIAEWAGPDAAIFVARDHNSLAVAARPTVSRGEGRLRVAYLSRITPKKNLQYALDVLDGIPEDIDFDIIGPAEDRRYWRRCRARLQTLPSNIRARHCGWAPHDRVTELLATYDMLFLPTSGENFGHVILESLAAGSPVLISDRTPWCDVEDCGAGWALPLEDPSAFRRAIEQHAQRSAAERDRWREGAARYAEAALARADADHCRLFSDLQGP